LCDAAKCFPQTGWCTRPERLIVINEAVQKLIDSTIDFVQEDKEDEEVKQMIKAKFDELRQWWKDWNTSAQTIDEMAVLPKKVEQFILQEEYTL